MRRQLKTRDARKAAWKKEKRDLSGRANGTIDPFYGCFLMSEVYDYANNFSFPWSTSSKFIGSFQLLTFFSDASPETSIQSLDDFGPLDVSDEFLTFSLSTKRITTVQFYDIPDGRNPPLALDPTIFLNGAYEFMNR